MKTAVQRTALVLCAIVAALLAGYCLLAIFMTPDYAMGMLPWFIAGTVLFLCISVLIVRRLDQAPGGARHSG
jgi:fatty acid desaturase